MVMVMVALLCGVGVVVWWWCVWWLWCELTRSLEREIARGLTCHAKYKCPCDKQGSGVRRSLPIERAHLQPNALTTNISKFRLQPKKGRLRLYTGRLRPYTGSMRCRERERDCCGVLMPPCTLNGCVFPGCHTHVSPCLAMNRSAMHLFFCRSY